jgi:hypothetical protein
MTIISNAKILEVDYSHGIIFAELPNLKVIEASWYGKFIPNKINSYRFISKDNGDTWELAPKQATNFEGKAI